MIFIYDRLDGNHTQLITLLQSKASLLNVKMCMASRPWAVFEDAFHQMASLRIYRTRRDRQSDRDKMMPMIEYF